MDKTFSNSKFKVLGGLIFSLYLLTACGDKTMSKFDWLASESAPKDYPMEIITGEFIYKEKGSLYVPNGKIIQDGWGESISTHVVGADLKSLPIQLNLTFFSYTENLFYQGSFELPYEQILNLFQQGYYSTKKRQQVTYHRIVAGVAPGGVVAVWIQGFNKSTQVFFGQAAKVDIPFEQIIDNPDYTRDQYVHRVIKRELSPESLESLNKNGVPYGRWDSYQTRYHWQPNLLTENRVPKNINEILYVNGEKDQLFYPLSPEVATATRALPSYFYYKWKSPEDKALAHDFHFDPEEIAAAFQKLHKIKPATAASPILLTVQVTESPEGRKITVGLQHEDETIILNNTKIEQRAVLFRPDDKDSFYQD